jgi:hypothetical protein
LDLNRIARGLTPARGLGLLEEARLFALLNLALMDSSVAVFDAKYTYNFVRPVTAIRNGDGDGNPRTEGDPGRVGPTPIDKLNLATGERSQLLELRGHTLGLNRGIDNAFLTRGGTAWAYAATELRADLYVVELSQPSAASQGR